MILLLLIFTNLNLLDSREAMKTFKQFLQENEWKKKGKDFIHTARIGKNTVDVLYNRRTGQRKDYDVNFYVNSSPLKNKQIKSKDGLSILRHVHSSIDSFIHDSNPNSMTFTSFENKKHNVYTKIARKMAKKHNAEHEEFSNSNKIILK